MTLSINGLLVLSSGVATITAYTPSPPPPPPFTLIYTVNSGDTITLPLYGTVNCTVDWGDGSTNSYTTTGNKTHTYASGGAKTVTISGALTEYGTASVSHPKLTSVTAFGDTGLTKLRFAFSGAANLSSVPNTLPTTVTDISGLFWDCTNFNSSAVTNWNTANVTLMQGMFTQARAFNQPIGSWNTASVTNMAEMFTFAVAFNQNVSNWNVGSVISMSNMFEAASAFNNGGSADINNWNITSVLDMSYMFSYAISFNQPLNLWNTSGVQLMNYMFENASAFNQDISSWATQGLTSCPPVFFARNSPLATQPAKLPTFICAAPVADFTATPTSGTTPLSVAFTDTSTNTPSSWAWDFTNDGSTDSTAQNPTNIYNSSGTFTVKMTATNARGSNTVTKTNYISVQNLNSFDLVYTVSAGDTIRVPLAGTVNCTVYWGDGTSDVYNTSGWKTHTYTSAGNKTVSIVGTLTGFGIQGGPWESKLTAVLSFGNVGLTSLNTAFRASNITSVPSTLPSTVTNLEWTFFNCPLFNDPNICNWNTQNVTSMDFTFGFATSFNQPIGSWNTNSLTNISYMFWNATSFNQPLDSWNTSSIIDFGYAFYNATSFNQPLGSWNTSSVLFMNNMFQNAVAFNQNIGSWNVSKVTNMGSMFSGASYFNQPIGNWNTISVTNMDSMFANASSFVQDLYYWCVPLISSQPSNFANGSSLDAYPQYFPNWGTCSSPMTIRVDTTLPDAANYVQFDAISPNNQFKINWGDGTTTYYNDGGFHEYTTPGQYVIQIYGNVTEFITYGNNGAISSVDSFGDLPFTNIKFTGCTNLTSVPSTLPTTITDTSEMFSLCTNFNSINVTNWNVSSVTNMSGMFGEASSFNRNISTWDVSAVTNMDYMFYNAAYFDQPIGTWNTSAVTTMDSMFRQTNIFNADISTWDVSSVTNMSSMFFNAAAFNQNLSGWCVSNISSLPVQFTGGPYGNVNFSSNPSYWPVWGTCPAPPTSPDLIATINTAAPDATDTISIFLGYDNVNCTIDWGDGNVSVYSVIGNADHTYTTSGTYTITISGTLDRISFENQNALISVNSWGNLSFTELSSCFSGCSNLISVPNNIPSTVTSLFGMFFNAYNFDQDIGGWDVSAVTDMSQMFRGSAFNNGNSNSINSWNTSLVTNMSSMFSQAPFNQPIGNWNVSSVVYMNNLFSFNFVFNQNISGWDVSNVTDMSSMFNYAGQFNQNLTGWCVQNIPSLPDDFATGSALDSANYPVWGTCP